MKSEQLLQAMGEIREDLIPEALPTTHKKRFRSRGFLAAAACFALVLALGITSYATGALDGLLQYFKGNTEPYLENLEDSYMATSNNELALRVDAAIADDSNCHLLLSLTGLTEEAKEKLQDDDPEEEWWNFRIYAKTKAGKFIDFHDIGFYGRLIAPSRSLLPDADFSVVMRCMFKDDHSMQEIDKIYIEYCDMTLKLDIAPYIVPQYTLQPEDEANATYRNVRVSDLGFAFDAPMIELFDGLRGVCDIGEIKLIRADGTTFDGPFGWESKYDEMFDDSACVFGYWNSDPEVVEIVDISEFCGLQIGEEIYLFEE